MPVLRSKRLLVITTALSLVALVHSAYGAAPRVKWCGSGADSCQQPGRGYTMCERFRKALDAVPPSQALPVCELALPPGFEDFQRPTWTSLTVANNWRMIYDMEMYLVVPAERNYYYTRWRSNFPDAYWSSERSLEDPVTWRRVPFDEWLIDYQRRQNAGDVEPRLSEAQVVINGQRQRLVRYERQPGGQLRECLESVKTEQVGEVGAFLFSATDDADAPVRPIVGTYGKADVLIYKGEAVFLGGNGPRGYSIDLGIALRKVGMQQYWKNQMVYQRCGLRGTDEP